MLSPSLDTTGLASFGHDFRVLAGETPPVLGALKDMEVAKRRRIDLLLYMLQQTSSFFNIFVTERQASTNSFRTECEALALAVLDKIRRDEKDDHSIIARMGKSLCE
jgi:hypothetical protein